MHFTCKPLRAIVKSNDESKARLLRLEENLKIRRDEERMEEVVWLVERSVVESGGLDEEWSVKGTRKVRVYSVPCCYINV